MIDTAWDVFWWTKITGAQYLTSEITSSLLNYVNTILIVPFDFPWRHQMRIVVENACREQLTDSEVFFDTIDVSDECCNVSPGNYLLNKYGIGNIKNQYRTNSDVSIQEYIQQHKILSNRILWIKGINRDDIHAWVTFCTNYTSLSLDDGLFFLEIQDVINIENTENIRVIKFHDFVSQYDVQVFNSFVLNDQKNLPEIWKKYISVLISSLCDTDAEISELLIRLIDFNVDDPIDGIAKIVEMQKYSSRGKSINSNHVLSLYRNGNFDELYYRIWTSQIQILFPLIEMEKIKIIKDFEEDIKETLKNNEVIHNGEKIDSISDIEIGTLSYMIRKKQNGEYMLYINNKSIRERILFLHECRNHLAHINCCTPKQVVQLLNYSYLK